MKDINFNNLSKFFITFTESISPTVKSFLIYPIKISIVSYS